MQALTFQSFYPSELSNNLNLHISRQIEEHFEDQIAQLMRAESAVLRSNGSADLAELVFDACHLSRHTQPLC